MPVSPARAAAFDILLRVERESSYASELLHSDEWRNLSEADHHLATELVMGVLRWRSKLDQEISAASSQPLSRLDLEILISLRLALYQMQWLDRIPQRAAIHESVELVKRARKRSAAPFVNAVLRKLSQTVEKAAIPPEAEAPSSVQQLANHFAHPGWLVERWVQQYGLPIAEKIFRYNQSIPTTSVRLRAPESENELLGEGVKLGPGELLSSARRVLAGDVTRTEAFRARQIVIQDEGSQLVAALVGHGIRILDCCAAPGGKTLAIADQNPDAEITAVEIHPHRARLIQKLVGSNGSQRIKIVVNDVCNLENVGSFDRVLADVPCSGTGTLARNPEIKWRLASQDLSDLHARQVSILRAAMKHVAPGGRLVYSTCSLEKEENQDVVAEALSGSKEFCSLDCSAELGRLKSSCDLTWSDPQSLTAGAVLRTIPGLHPCDGFFAAILERR